MFAAFRPRGMRTPEMGQVPNVYSKPDGHMVPLEKGAMGRSLEGKARLTLGGSVPGKGGGFNVGPS